MIYLECLYFIYKVSLMYLYKVSTKYDTTLSVFVLLPNFIWWLINLLNIDIVEFI